MATWTTIPTTFGTGGSGINPTGSAPTLYSLLKEIHDQVDAGADTTTNGTNIANIYKQIGTGNPEEISSSGALSVVKRTTRLTVSGTKAYTLPDGTIAGQRKSLYCVAASGTPVGVVTPAHASGFTTITFGASSATSAVELEWDASLGTPAWKVVQVITVSGGTLTIA